MKPPTKPKPSLTVKNISNKLQDYAKRTNKFDDFSGCTALYEFIENQIRKQKFESQVFIVIIDNVQSTLANRMEAYRK
ncbi:hypothetical protein TNCT_3271 [Trichonephila clavata]|uniref:Uncharacterized protein n=1 Tax=Trichonephila clavata TaxID=2740835 RepID=A0A8X6KXK3_TRICU|nr:hypothetical protein TNCT_3271 [Trichonephila clavata]